MSSFPIASYYFSVDYGGEIQFQDITGIVAEYDVDEVVNGYFNGSMVKIPKKLKFTPIVMKKGIMKTEQLKSLMNDIGNVNKNLKDKVSAHKKDITIHLKDEKGAISMTFKLIEAIPIKYNISKFNAQENSIAIEELSFVYKNIEIS